MKIYFAGVVFGALVDIVYGRLIGDLWFYPHLIGWLDFIFPVFIYYPISGFFIYELYYFLRGKFSKIYTDKSQYLLSNQFKTRLMILLIIVFILGAILPVINYYYGNYYANHIIVIFMILTTFSPDAIAYFFTKKSILISFIEGNPVEILTMIGSWFLAMVLTEYPNTFSREWIYTNIPFIQTEILGVNVLIATFGWFFLVFAPIRFIDLARYSIIKKINL